MVSLDLAIQLTASALTVAGMFFYGNKSSLGPWIGLTAQVPWWLIMVHGGLWGLLPVNLAMFIVHGRNLIKWRRDAHREATLRREDNSDAEAIPGNHP